MYIEMYTYCSYQDEDVQSYMYASVFISEISYMKWMKCRIFITFIEDCGQFFPTGHEGELSNVIM